MALAHESGSFDYKVINKNIRKILDARSQLDNTVQVGMPFVKATTTIAHEYLGAGDNKGFTLGLHGINQDVEYQNMFSSQNGLDPLIGYTYTKDGGTQLVYAKNPETEVYKTANSILDKQSTLVTYPESSKFIRIPPPGITNATIGRNKNGLLVSAQLQISIPSLIQLEALHRTFLIPGVGMVLEWGQQFAPYGTNEQYAQLTDITEYMFPWHDRTELDKKIVELAKREIGLTDILDNYVYPSNGQYMWMFGRVATFDVKSNSDGSFSSTVKIVGPSEDAWAYSTRNTVIPRKPKGSPYFCGSDTNSVYSYFANSIAAGKNFKTLLDGVTTGTNKDLAAWKDHVIHFQQGNQTGGEPKPNSPTATTEEKTFADNQEAYFMTWRFFVNVVMNNDQHGVRSIFNTLENKDVVNSIGLLLPYGNGVERDTNIAKLPRVDDPKECFVGSNKYLRSIDPSVMVIVNEKAVDLANKNVQYNILNAEESVLTDNDDTKKFRKPTVLFEASAEEYTNVSDPDRGFLSSGVWINHKAVVEAMLSADTILRGISNLLEKMNQATGNFWQLTLDVVEGEKDKNPQTYTVVDANWRDSSYNAVNKFINDVHVFNKYIRTANGNLVGSELIECNIDLSLPKRLFAQIATLGLLSKEDIAKIGAQEAKVGDTLPTGESEDFSTKISDPNNTLAEMFGIISLSPKDKKSPDLTILAMSGSTNPNGTCGKANTQLVAGTGGQGYQVADVSLNQALSTIPDERTKAFNAATTAISSPTCNQCAPCLAAKEAETVKQPIVPPDAYTIKSAKDDQFPNLEFTQSTINDTVSEALLKEVNQIFASEGVRGRVSSAHRSPTYRDQVANSRHISGAALDIDAVYVGSVAYSVQRYESPNYTGDAKVGAELLDRIKAKLLAAGFAQSEGSNKKAVLWRTAGHYDHMHISRLPDTESLPKPTTTPPVNNSSTDVCKPIFEKVGNGDAKKGEEECKRCARHNEVVNQVTNTTQTAVDAAVRKFAGFRQGFRYVEIFPELMIASIAADADGNKSNAFGASPGSLSISGDLVMPGINGLRVGELFWIDRVPAFYKVFGAFQIMSIEDTIGIDGWKTKVNARFNYLGRVWKESMVRILNVKP